MLTKSAKFQRISDLQKYNREILNLWHPQNLHTLKICMYTVTLNTLLDTLL